MAEIVGRLVLASVVGAVIAVPCGLIAFFYGLAKHRSFSAALRRAGSVMIHVLDAITMGF